MAPPPRRRPLVYPPGESLGAPGAVTEQLPGPLQDPLGPAHETTQHPDPIAEQSAVARVGDVGLYHRAVGPELTAPRRLVLEGQGYRPLVEAPERLGADQVRPADQRRVVGRGLQVQPAELPQDQRVRDVSLGGLEAPIVEAPYHQHPQDHLHRRGAAPEPLRVRVALGQVGLEPDEELVVIEQPVERGELGFHLQAQLRGYQLEEVHGIVAVYYHVS